MGEVLIRVRALLGSRWISASLALLTVAGCALTALPLLNQPGYELAAALAVAHGLTGGLLALAASRVDRSQPLRSALALTGLLWASAGLVFVVATLVAWTTTRCDPFATAIFFPLLPLPSGLVSVSLGTWLGTFDLRRLRASLAWLGVVLTSAATTTWPILFGPQVFAFDHLGGYLPGPLYDEELHLPASLLWFRLASLVLALGVLGWVAGKRRLALVAAAAFALLELNGTRLGFRMTDGALIAALGGTREDGQLTLHYPRALTPTQVDRVFEDVRFRYAQVAEFLGARPDGRVTVWWYESAARKQQLVGAAHTQFSKPWRREVHVNAIDFPHPVIKHELVHAMASVWGSPPFGVTARFGLFPNAAIVEGLAVAADNPVDDLRLHEWAAAMKKKGLLPDVRALVGADGFYGAPASRAYATAGSFLRYLTETYGAEKTRRLYRDGDFEGAYGISLDALATSFEKFLDQVPLEDAAVNQAFARFKGGSIFDRPCAREVALLVERASEESGDLALETWRRCRALQPEEPAHVLAESRVLRHLERDEEARALLDPLLARLEGEPSAWAEAAMDRVALATKQGQGDIARPLLERIISRQVSAALERTARVRLAGLNEPAVRRYFDGTTSDAATLYFLRGAFERGQGSWAVRYLLGRKLQQVGEAAEALPLLEETSSSAEVPLVVAREAARLSLEAALAAKDCEGLARLATTGRFGAAFDARAADWVARCRFSMVAPPP